ncbi:hypothetical protein BCR43DRAFT_485271 [Syncephalastrum racemosum]|uniref:Uncharacterized protein n=1 Tax=Syncephalastrum racemosum TaxID=13706 RepID=A0A1X2HMB1_SYNRA|nr:hypothetical protein BCR43DRAFT_485271 [Syncephalastrum racemosum]
MCKETTEVPRPHWFSTGHDNLDALLGGGFRSNYAIEIAGPYASKSKVLNSKLSPFPCSFLLIGRKSAWSYGCISIQRR